MFTALLQIKNYKLFVVNMLLLGMGIAVTVPYLILFATKDLGMTTTQYGLLLALAAISQFIVNSIIARFSDTHHLYIGFQKINNGRALLLYEQLQPLH